MSRLRSSFALSATAPFPSEPLTFNSSLSWWWTKSGLLYMALISGAPEKSTANSPR